MEFQVKSSRDFLYSLKTARWKMELKEVAVGALDNNEA